jgi:hypothetical protein
MMLLFQQTRGVLLLLACVVLMSPMVRAVQWTIYHSYDGGESYSRRGTLEWKGEAEGLVITNDELTAELARDILSSAWYKVKIETTTTTTEGEYVLATVPSCHLRRANFKDEFSLTFPRMGSDNRAITSLAYIPLVSPLAPKSCDEYEPDQLVPTENTAMQWNSKVTATLDTPGMTLRSVLPTMKAPPGLSWTTSNKGGPLGSSGGTPGGDRGGRPDGEQPTDERPFYVKYWYVLLPLVLAQFMPGPEAPKQSTPVGAEQAGGGGDPAVSAVADGGGAPKRRGKRG